MADQRHQRHGRSHHHHGHHHQGGRCGAHRSDSHLGDPHLGDSQLSSSHLSSVGRLKWAFFLNLCFAIAELLGGWWAGSVAIIANSIHDFGDSATLLIALQLESRAQTAATQRFSYGFKRLSLLSAFLAGVVLISGSILVSVQAVERLMGEAHLPEASAMMAFSVFGLLVNGFAAHRLRHGQTHNEKILTWHMIEDVLGWVAVLIGGILVKFFAWSWVDPLLALGVSAFVGWNAFRHLLKTMFVFMQSVPSEVDPLQLRNELKSLKGIIDIHDLHIWSLDGAEHVMTLHARVAADANVAHIKIDIRHLASHSGIGHTTIEVESDGEKCGENCDPS